MAYRLTRFLLALCVLVIVWGAFVRFTHSGAGCGEHWPLCKGVLLPESTDSKTWIEYFHRITSGLFGLGVLGVFLLILRGSEYTLAQRRAVGAVLIFTIIEALIGAGLVLRGLVESDASVERFVWVGSHLLNTLLLLGSLVWLLFELRGGGSSQPNSENRKRVFLIFIAAFFLTAVLGSIASLSNTLSPSPSLFEGLAADLNPESPWYLKVRVFHPLISVLFGVSLIFYLWADPAPKSRAQTLLVWLVGLNLLLGFGTLLFLSPIAAKLLHLLIADFIWIALVWSYLESSSPKPALRAAVTT